MTVTLTEKPVKHCLECGEPIGPGRGDRKFCNDLCKTSYHNQKRREPTAADEFSYFNNAEMPAIRKVYHILLKNWSILYSIGQYDGAILDLRDLLGHGFNLKYFTSEYRQENGDHYKFCFNLGYRITPKEEVMIIYRPKKYSLFK